MLFGVGSNVRGGLVDAISGNSSGSVDTSTFEDQVERPSGRRRPIPRTRRHGWRWRRAEYNRRGRRRRLRPRGRASSRRARSTSSKRAVQAWERYLALEAEEARHRHCGADGAGLRRPGRPTAPAARRSTCSRRPRGRRRLIADDAPEPDRLLPARRDLLRDRRDREGRPGRRQGDRADAQGPAQHGHGSARRRAQGRREGEEGS